MRCGNSTGQRLFCGIGAALTLLVMVVFPACAEALPEEFLGKFQGAITGDVGDLEGNFNLVSQAGRSGFLMSWPPNRSAAFEVSDKPGIFHADFHGRLIEGTPAFWARLEGRKLIVYSMQIDEHGGYDLYSYIYEPVDGGLDLTVRQLRSGSTPLESKGRLKRYAK
jgi:hypothetical protein